MPAQTTQSGTAYYSENDRYPPLIRQLLDGDGNPLNLGDLPQVFIRISPARYSHYYSPYTPIVEAGSCTILDPPEDGWVSWEPGEGELSPPGTYHYVYEIIWPGNKPQTVPPNTYETLVIRTKPGGIE